MVKNLYAITHTGSIETVAVTKETTCYYMICYDTKKTERLSKEYVDNRGYRWYTTEDKAVTAELCALARERVRLNIRSSDIDKAMNALASHYMESTYG